MTLDEAIEAASRAWPGVAVPLDEAQRWVLERAGEVSIDDLCVDDLYLCCACARRDAQALAHFERTYLTELDVVLERFGENIAEDAVQAVRVKLLGPALAITSYRGRGDLRSWVKVTAMRVAIELYRATKPVEPEQRALEQVAEADAEFDYLRRENGHHLKAAIARAVEQLEVRERNLLRQHLFDRLTIDELGNLYQVNRVTAFRWIRSAREKLVQKTRAELAQRLGLDDQSLDSLLRAADSQLDMSLKRLL